MKKLTVLSMIAAALLLTACGDSSTGAEAKAATEAKTETAAPAKCAADGKPLLGICLGMQLLYEKNFEDGEYEGLGLLKGDVIPFKPYISKDLKIPHMGWNKLEIKQDSPLFKYLGENEFVYYVHSYFARGNEKDVLASSEYDIEVPGVVGHDNIMGMQFHPEKSSSTGLKLLKAFGEMIKW